MAFNGSGTFNRLYSWATDAANNVNISSSRMDGEDNGFAAGLSNCITRDGQSPWLANIPAGGFKITGLANGSAATDSVAYGQLANYLLLSGGTLTGTLNGTSISLSANLIATGNITAGGAISPGNLSNYYLSVSSSNPLLNFDMNDYLLYDRTANTLNVYIGSTNVLSVGASGALTTPAAANAVGYKGIPQNAKTSSYTLVLGDFGQDIYISGTTAGQTITIPANASVAFPIGAFVTITNDSNQNWSIAITSDTLFWTPSGGTGTRTLAAGGTATITKKTSTRWWIMGTGLS